MKKKSNGFTLVELLAVIVVLALIMAIAIPSILSTTNSAKKESFYLYAQSLQSKAIAAYTQDMENDPDVANCVVYDIEEGLDLSNTGDYEGWVKVERVAVTDEERREATITVPEVGDEFPSGATLEYVNYCIAKKNTECPPDTSVNFPEGAERVTVSQTLKEGQTLYVNYQYGYNGQLITVEKKAIPFEKGAEIVSKYDYEVTLTIKNNEYYVKGLNIYEDMSKKTFYKALDGSKDAIKKAVENNTPNPMAINQLVCGDLSEEEMKTTSVKGTTKARGTSKATTTTITTNGDCPTLKDDEKKYTVYLAANGGTVKNTKFEYCVDCTDFEEPEIKDIETPTRDGYTFAGWYYDKTYTKKVNTNKLNKIDKKAQYDARGCLTGYADVTIHAKWSKNAAEATTTTVYVATDNQNESNKGNRECPSLTDDDKKFNVNLSTNGGTANITNYEYCAECTEVKEIEIPTRNGYTFAGWYYDKTYTKKVTNINNTYTLNNIEKQAQYDATGCITGYADITIHAKWNIISTSATTTTKYVASTDPKKTTSNYIVSTDSPTTTSNYIVSDPDTTTRATVIATTTTTTIDTTDYTLLLDTLNIAGYNINFSPIKFYYELTIPTSVESLNITYQPHTPDQTDVYLLNNTNLKVGDTWVIVKLENKETKKQSNYRILVKKLSNSESKITTAKPTNDVEWDPESGLPDPTLDESNAALSSLTVSGYVFEFDPNVYEYVLQVHETKELHVNYSTYAPNAHVNVQGADNISDGSVITIYVQSPNSFYNKTYKIEVHFYEETSGQTKFLRNACIVLGITLIIMLTIIKLNKNQTLSIIKRKKIDKDNNPDNIV